MKQSQNHFFMWYHACPNLFFCECSFSKMGKRKCKIENINEYFSRVSTFPENFLLCLDELMILYDWISDFTWAFPCPCFGKVKYSHKNFQHLLIIQTDVRCYLNPGKKLSLFFSSVNRLSAVTLYWFAIFLCSHRLGHCTRRKGQG